MGFDFFKKKGKDDKESPDDLEFDDLERSGEFLSGASNGENYPPPPPPEPPAPPGPSYPPPPPPQAAPPPPPPPPPPPVRPPDMADDITIVNAPSVPRAPQQPVPPPPPPPPAGAAPPAPPGPPRPPVPPGQATRPPQPRPQPGPVQPGTPPPVPQAPQQPVPQPPGTADEDVTQVLNTPVAKEAVVAWLVIAAGEERGRDFRLPGGTIRLGQSPACEIQLARDTFISTQHAEISFRGGAFWLKDLNSTNGTFVNGVPVTEVALRDEDRVKLGMTEMVFKSLKL